IYKALNCSGVCRVDFIYEEDEDQLYFLEINTTPGQSEQSIVPQQVRAIGKDTKWLYNTILGQLNL
ncbi:MAG: D-alanine--D-alanine ligase, partial [Bacteroidales bacterium]|nr:D-alanine--D-alanine ligase [Bacteroidales bacterium]